VGHVPGRVCVSVATLYAAASDASSTMRNGRRFPGTTLTRMARTARLP
jgi:hypothetical protein